LKKDKEADEEARSCPEGRGRGPKKVGAWGGGEGEVGKMVGRNSTSRWGSSGGVMRRKCDGKLAGKEKAE